MNKTIALTVCIAAVGCGGLETTDHQHNSDRVAPQTGIEEVEGTQSALLNGSDALSPAFNAVVHIESDNPHGACTGVLVSSRHVLTSKSCLFDSESTATWGDGGGSANIWHFPYMPRERAPAGQTLVSGAKTAGGHVSYEPGVNIPGYDHTSFSTSGLRFPASSCQLNCRYSEGCTGFTHSEEDETCYIKKRFYRVRFGGDLAGAPTHVVNAYLTNHPGGLDLAIISLSQNLPSSIAQPLKVLTDIPSDNANDYLGSVAMRMIGFGGGGRRQIASAELADFPFAAAGVEGPNMLRAIGFGCSPLEPNDKGGPLLAWIRGRWTVVGIAQGSEPCGGRYLTTFNPGGPTDVGQANGVGRYLDGHVTLSWWNTQNTRRSGTLYVGDATADGRADLLCHDQHAGTRFASYSFGNQVGAIEWRNDSPWCRHQFSQLHTGDFNGDGRMDLLCHSKNNGSLNLDYAASSGSYNGSDWSRSSGVCSSPGARLYTGDFNRDGRDDLLCLQPTGRMDVWSASASGQFNTAPSGSRYNFCGHFNDGALYVGDFNGDGRDDVLCHHKRSGIRQINYSDNALDGRVDFQNSAGFCRHEGTGLYIGDFDGDNHDDMLCHTRSSGWRDVDLAYDGFWGNDLQAKNAWCVHTEAELRVGDFNNDGRTDLLCHTGSNGHLSLDYANTSGGFGGTNAQFDVNFCEVKQSI